MMTRYAVETRSEKFHGRNKPLSSGNIEESQRRISVDIIDRRIPGSNQRILSMENVNDVSLADDICAFLNSR